MVFNEEFEKDILEKEHKKIYNEYVKKMITYMTKISLTLKSINPEDRKTRLLAYIKKINGIIEANRKKYLSLECKKVKFLDYFHGITIPFSKNENSAFSSNLVKLKFMIEFIGVFLVFSFKKDRAPH